MSVRLIVTDLDGTLVDPVGQVSAINRQALALAVDRGVPVVVATGRPSRWLQVLDDLPVHREVVVSNGAGVFDLPTRRHTVVHGLDPRLSLEVAEDLREAIPGTVFAFEWGEHFGCEPGLPQERGNWLKQAPLDELAAVDRPVLKLCAFHAELDSDALALRGRAVIGDRLTMTHSHLGSYGLLEISAPGVTKASGLTALCAGLGVPPADVAAFGDMPNDLPMLTWAGHGYAIADGHPTVIGAGFRLAEGPQDEAVGRTILQLLS
ncbi:MAG: HAD hydrolase family protein [Micropruina sp.]|uniref:HAD hydrolase family protein n=1 Tax=Micropruina sp. TaxID=2737536 RepID=UPI0039E5C282